MKRAMMCMVVAGVLAFGAGLAAGAGAPAGETKSGATTVVLPDAACAAIMKAFPKATMGTVSARGREVKIYSVAMTEGDKKFTVRVSEAGVIIAVSTPISVADLPKAVAEAVAAGANGATTTNPAAKVEMRADSRGTKVLDKPEIVYEVQLTKGDTSGMMRVAEDGTVKRALELRPITKRGEAPATTSK